MIHFFAHAYATPGTGPSKFTREVRSRMGPAELTLYTEDVRDVPEPGVVALPRRPWWVKSNLAYFAYQNWQVRKVFPGSGVHHNDVAVFNHVITGYTTYAHSSVPTVGFINDDNNIRFRDTSTRRSQRIQRGVLRKIESHASHRATLTVVNSHYLKREVNTAYDVPLDRIFVLHKGVDTEIFDQPYLPVPSTTCEPIRLLFAKSDWRRGNLPTLLEAIAQVATRRPVSLRVAGTDGSDVHEPPSNAAITYLGVVSAEAIRVELARAHIFCTPASFEALGVANIEAMLCRTPVIATDVGGIPEVTAKGRYASEVAPGDSHAIARAIEDICADPVKTALRVEEARTYVREKFPIERSVSKLREACELARDLHSHCKST